MGHINVMAFLWIHLAGLAAFWTDFSGAAVGLAAVSFAVRMFGITAGYHRYFSHKSYQAGRRMQFALAFLGCAAAQKGPLWWAAHHRTHHQEADGPRDPHSPTREGFWWSHVGWVLSPQFDATDYAKIQDFARYPELRWLNKYFLVPPALWALGCYGLMGWTGVVWGFFISTTALWHGTFLVNSVAHLVGRRRFPTRDTSRNSFLLALITLGEGWHNNHHFFPSSVNQGFYWWEVDITRYILRLFSAVGLVKNLRPVPERILAAGRHPAVPPPLSARVKLGF